MNLESFTPKKSPMLIPELRDFSRLKKLGAGFYYGHKSLRTAYKTDVLTAEPIARIDKRNLDIKQEPEVQVFISKMGLETAVTDAVKIVREVFADVSEIKLELDLGDDEEGAVQRVLINVKSSMNADATVEAYFEYYRKLLKEISLDDLRCIGLSF